MNTAQHLRQKNRQQRRALSKAQQRTAAKKLCHNLQCSPLFNRAKRIAFYWPNDGEISPVPLAQALHQQGKQLFLPSIKKDQLVFLKYQKHHKLVDGKFGINQPTTRRQYHAKDMDIILMPLVAFDSSGNRLGMGGGFYDRTLAFTKKQIWRQKPTLIGLAHSLQQQEQLEARPWDIALDDVMVDNLKKSLMLHKQ